MGNGYGSRKFIIAVVGVALCAAITIGCGLGIYHLQKVYEMESTGLTSIALKALGVLGLLGVTYFGGNVVEKATPAIKNLFNGAHNTASGDDSDDGASDEG